MPFLDHLEELRWRIIWSLLALMVGVVVGFYAVQQWDLLELLKQPVAPYLPEGKLLITKPADAFMITMKLAILVGFVLAAPVVLAQAWRFFSPALYEHERKFIIPILWAAVFLFIAGLMIAYIWVLPAALKFLLMFNREDLNTMIAANEYISFAVQLMVAFGLVFELPLVMIMLSALGVVEPRTFEKQRAMAYLVLSVVAAVVTPADVASMLLMLGPLVLLYEAGILFGKLVTRRGRTIGAVLLALALAAGAGAGTAHAQEAQPPPRGRRQVEGGGGPQQDSLALPLDTAAARALGLPTAPSRSLPQPDSIMRALLTREGFIVTRYGGDSITLFGATREILLRGAALVEREQSILEAARVTFREAECSLYAEGAPALFDGGTVLTGEGMRYDTCLRRGRVAQALTSFKQSGVEWFLRGGLEIDSASTRVYGASNDVTSCNLPTPHYHFSTGNIKWVTNTIMVARPAVLYIRDVPIMWLPFIFQDMRPGRRSGILVPRFGLSDLIRPNDGYRRHVSNIGFYFAVNDYSDAQISLDWFAGNYLGVNGQLRYRWLDRFVAGGLSVSRLWEAGLEGQPGSRSLRLQWNHQQSFNQRTRLTADVDYATSARVVQRNTVDPFVQTATLGSRINFNKQFSWGTMALGGSLSQDLSNGGSSQTLPTFSLTPRPLDIGTLLTWSPSVSVTNTVTRHQGAGIPLAAAPVDGIVTTDTLFPIRRQSDLRFNTPLRVGRWNWQNSFSISDRYTNTPMELVLPDPANPDDSIVRVYGEDFQTAVDWNTGINLPTLFGSTWKLQPSLGIRNTTGGAFLIRNQYTNGAFVSQGKRLSFGASMTPTVFGFFPGVGPLARIRHAVSPIVSWSYAPEAEVPEAYARALDPRGLNVQRTSPALHQVSFGLSQTIEGKFRLAEGDTTTDERNVRKIKILSIQTSSVAYDFEQAKEEGRNGWTTQLVGNQFTSDLLPGFTVSMQHDLWNGPVGYDSTAFKPFLTSVSARFNISAATIRGIAGLVAGREPEPEDLANPQDMIEPVQPAGTATGPTTRLDPALNRGLGASGVRRGRGFQASVSYDDRRDRPRAIGDSLEVRPPNRTMGLTVGFSPSPNWSVSWNTQYNLTLKEFGQHVLRLDRDLHRWRATFAFTKAPNGNFAFNFFVTLTDEPEIQFQYDQRTVRRAGR